MKRIAYKEMFDNELDHAWYVATRNLMLNYLKRNVSKRSKILDVGCGTGGTIIYLKAEGFKRITGIDNSVIALSYCRRRKISNIDEGSINNLPYKDNSFDAAICLDVLYHQGVNAERAVAEISRVLKKGGIFYTQEPALNFLNSRHDIAISTRDRFTRKKIKNILEANNLFIKRITYYNTFLFPLIAIKRLIEKSRKKEVKSDVQKIPVLANRLFLKILQVESALASKINLPFGLSIISISQKQ